MLSLVATPIGNLKDITLRALEILKECDYILCEDTRHSLKLLSHYAIRKPLKSYHQHNEQSRVLEILEDLKLGKHIALISDAGTPGISDPGAVIVQACRDAGINVQSIPGACAAISAISASGLSSSRFQFLGFLPKKLTELQDTLRDALRYPGTTIFYESPQRLIETLEEIQALSPTCKVAIARELTKKHEQHLKGSPEFLLKTWEHESPKGELVLMIEGQQESDTLAWQEMSPTEHVSFLEKTYQMPKNDAIKLAAKMRGVTKSSLYKRLHTDEKN